MVTGPGVAKVAEVAAPTAGPGEVVVDVERAGICGTDVELFTGEMAYLHQGHAHYPLRLGHEWCGRISSLGEGVDRRWLGRRVTGDTMLGCGSCERCRRGHHHVCERRFEIGIRGGWPGALAEQLPLPVTAAHELDESLSAAAGALVEPGGGALRAINAAQLEPGHRLLILGGGTIGLLCAMFARARGAVVTVADPRPEAVSQAERFGADSAIDLDQLPAAESFAAVIDASTGTLSPERALRLVEPAGRVVLIGLSVEPSLIDSRDLIFKDLTMTAILGASAGLAGAIDLFASRQVVPDGLVADVIGLDEVARALTGHRRPVAGPGPKIQVDPGRA